MTNHSNGAIFHNAVERWWLSKGTNEKAITRSQGGKRDGNLRGDTMDGFRDALRRRLVQEGVPQDDIFSAPQISRLPSNLPSFFRASKTWDLLVCRDSLYKDTGTKPTLLAAIEFKSQHESIGNNQNNRIEESVGTATDFWAAYENGSFMRLLPRPWLGYLFVGVYEQKDLERPVEVKQPHLPTDKVFAGPGKSVPPHDVKFRGASYSERYRIALSRMLAKKLYDGACLIATNEALRGSDKNYMEPYAELGAEAFIDGMVRYVTRAC